MTATPARIVAIAAALTLAIAAPAFATSTAADNYVIKTVGAAEKLAADYHTMITIWTRHGSTYGGDYQAAVHFYTQIEALIYRVAPAPADTTPIQTWQPEEELYSSVGSLPSDVELVEGALQYSFERSQLKADVNTLIQDVATYNSNLRRLWSLAGVAHPPVLH